MGVAADAGLFKFAAAHAAEDVRTADSVAGCVIAKADKVIRGQPNPHVTRVWHFHQYGIFTSHHLVTLHLPPPPPPSFQQPTHIKDC